MFFEVVITKILKMISTGFEPQTFSSKLKKKMNKKLKKKIKIVKNTS